MTQANHDTSQAEKSSWRKVPKGVWVLGFVSMFMDISSEMVHSLLPIFLVASFAATPVWVGLIEGIAEATASITKVFSGVISDWIGRRKMLAVIGYGLAAFTKPVFPLAGSIGWLVTARFVDRIGKGIRGAPRDALVADISPPELHGASFGLRQSLDTIGAVIGPVLAIALMFAFSDNIRMVFWVAVIPAFLAVGLLVVAVRDPRENAPLAIRPPPGWADAKRLDIRFWAVAAVGTVMTFARFSEAFLVLKVNQVGMVVQWVPLVLVIMNVIYAASAFPAGIMSDRIGRRGLLAVGLGVLILADIVLAAAGGVNATLAGVVLWGLHMGLTQGLLSALVADYAPKDLRGTAFGIFNLCIGLAALVASVVAGLLWQFEGATATFVAGAIFSGLSLAGLVLLPKPLTPGR